jgi:heme/copper-type cytochrome/quinol oxidase subunit 3
VSSQPAEVPIPVERPSLEARVVTVGAYLLSAGTVFFFVAFLFAFFYLRALNSNDMWAGPNGKHVSVPTASGIVILVCVLLSVVLVRLALHDLRGSRRGSWYPLGLAALLLGLAAVAVQCWQYTDLAFGTEEGGYASVYLGWTGAFALFAFGAMIWLEILLATARRASSPPVAEESSVASFSIFWTTLGVVQLFAFILLFGVK